MADAVIVMAHAVRHRRDRKEASREGGGESSTERRGTNGKAAACLNEGQAAPNSTDAEQVFGIEVRQTEGVVNLELTGEYR